MSVELYAYLAVSNAWDAREWHAFRTIINKESGWRVTGAHNPALSSAYGLAGFLDATWESVGCIKTSNPYEQIRCAIPYIQQRYETPSKALVFHRLNNWY